MVRTWVEKVPAGEPDAKRQEEEDAMSQSSSPQRPLLEGKVAVVSGAGGGIGREIALAMALAGARVIINDIGASLTGEGQSASPAEETRAIIRQRGGEAEINTDSVAEWGSARRIVESALDHFGRIDIVVNNAGILRDVIFHKMTPEDWLSVINVHLNGSFFLSRAAAEHFRRQESGAYVHMTSTSGLIGNFGQANYAAAKLGIVALSKSIALDMKRYNVRSNCIAPFAWSRMTSSIPAETPEQKARVEKIKQMTPEKNAPMAVYLASDAAREVTGQVFAVRHNEIFLMSAPRPIRSVHRSEGWTPETIAEHAIPALRDAFMPLDRSGEVFSWDPI
jgi:NAD(P)-dependent dehydrogenase (short-subunit alcohol dehydrogenase family)